MRPPRISVVVPTYNRSQLLERTLLQLTRQTLPLDEFEVIVADDGSSDDTRRVVDSFADRLRIGYHFQEDLGFRAGTARNAGARLATAPVLCFLDTGAIPAAGFLHHHLAEHEAADRPAIVVGYAYGYDPEHPVHALDRMRRMSPEEIVAELHDDPGFRDIRHVHFDECGFDLHRRSLPWNLLFTINCSLLASDFHAVGGFNEDLTGWGGEDLELGYLLHRHGLRFRISRAAWVIESPHARPDIEALLDTFRDNVERSLRRYPDSAFEVGWALIGMNRPFFTWNDEYRTFLEWHDKVRGETAAEEIAAARREAGPDARIVVFGAGAVLPADANPIAALDFDRAAVDALAHDGHPAQYAIGLRTPLAAGSADLVVITSRLAGLWERWHRDLLAEARRVGGSVRCTFPADIPEEERS
jgi:glycosyltransferase involved in cell wall biosynthesis